MKFTKLKAGMAAILAAGAAAAGYSAQADTPELLQSLERGLWQLRAVGGGTSTAAASQLCIGDPRMLVQIQHGSTTLCTHYVVRSTPTSVTISYTCKGSGQGLTTIRKESPRLVQIQSQGIKDGAPFSFSVEGRRTATCER
ncbi:MAG: hypothetical protein ACK4SJ_03930 [Sphingorhabdus sp.]|nr:hypothetical protein [Sphingorhabdus sp.]